MVFFEVRKKMRPKRVLGCFLVPADPRKPKYSLCQTQFRANQHFSDSKSFLTQKDSQITISLLLFGDVLDLLVRCFFDVFSGAIFSSFGSLFGSIWDPIGEPKREQREEKRVETSSFLPYP